MRVHASVLWGLTQLVCVCRWRSSRPALKRSFLLVRFICFVLKTTSAEHCSSQVVCIAVCLQENILSLNTTPTRPIAWLACSDQQHAILEHIQLLKMPMFLAIWHGWFAMIRDHLKKNRSL
jgi:hypothetical protein